MENKSKNYAIKNCSMDKETAQRFGIHATIVARFFKLYKKIQKDCPELLSEVIEKLPNV